MKKIVITCILIIGVISSVVSQQSYNLNIVFDFDIQKADYVNAIEVVFNNKEKTFTYTIQQINDLSQNGLILKDLELEYPQFEIRWHLSKPKEIIVSKRFDFKEKTIYNLRLKLPRNERELYITKEKLNGCKSIIEEINIYIRESEKSPIKLKKMSSLLSDDKLILVDYDDLIYDYKIDWILNSSYKNSYGTWKKTDQTNLLISPSFKCTEIDIELDGRDLSHFSKISLDVEYTFNNKLHTETKVPKNTSVKFLVPTQINGSKIKLRTTYTDNEGKNTSDARDISKSEYVFIKKIN